MADLVGKIIDYEEGMMSDIETVHFFAEMIQTGMVWGLQGHYGRVAQNLIEQGLINEAGEVNEELLLEVIDESA